jgi:serine/threonine protein kinase
LIYLDSTSGTAEKWQAKLADFSHSIVLNEEQSQGFPLTGSMIRGTERYNAPEVTDNAAIQDCQFLKLTDIWSYGLLVLEVLLDGDEQMSVKKFGDQQHFTFEQRRETLIKVCEQHLYMRHWQDQSLIQVAVNLAESCLQRDPMSRPKASALLAYLQEKIAVLQRYNNVSPSQTPITLTPLDGLPFFHVSDHYYDLLATLTVPQQIFQGLRNIVENYPLSHGEYLGTPPKV